MNDQAGRFSGCMRDVIPDDRNEGGTEGKAKERE